MCVETYRIEAGDTGEHPTRHGCRGDREVQDIERREGI